MTGGAAAGSDSGPASGTLAASGRAKDSVIGSASVASTISSSTSISSTSPTSAAGAGGTAGAGRFGRALRPPAITTVIPPTRKNQMNAPGAKVL